MTRFDPPPEGVTPRMTSAQAYKAWGDQGGAPPEGEPEVWFASYTDFGQGQMLDNGGVDPSHVRQPVWVIRFKDTEVEIGSGAYGGGPARGGGGTIAPKKVVIDVVGVVDDATGQPLVTMQSKPDDPPAPWRSEHGPGRREKTCPADLSKYKTGLVDDGGTPLPTGFAAFTQPHAVIRASNGDVYQVWGGAGSPEHPLSGPAEAEPAGQVVVSHVAADPCASPEEPGGPISFHAEPSRTGIVTIIAIKGDSVRYRTSHGVEGTYSVVTATFDSVAP